MKLEFRTNWEASSSPLVEDRVTHCSFGIFMGEQKLTEAIDQLAETTTDRANLSAYRLAEWLAWNWYRLRWEPRKGSLDWSFAHRMATIGGGYIWPNITIFSDGYRIALVAEPSARTEAGAIRYTSKQAVVTQAVEFERTVDGFINKTIARLEAKEQKQTNLQEIWASLLEDRQDPEQNQRRRFEAIYGAEPDQLAAEQISAFEETASEFGLSSTEEVLATSQVISVQELKDRVAKGVQYDPESVAGRGLIPFDPRLTSQMPWKLGYSAAKQLRLMADISPLGISNKQLTELAAADGAILEADAPRDDFAFAVEGKKQDSRIVLRSKVPTGKRFELARLLGDQMLYSNDGSLFVATKTQTYRQKFQRAFAAELLCPFNSMHEMLKGEYGQENMEDVASVFGVSPLLVQRQLINHGIIPRDDLDADFETAA